MKSLSFLAVAALLAGLPAPVLAGQSLNLPVFTSVKASDGAKVVIRHGEHQQVILAAGSTEHSRIEVRDGVLVIETCKDWFCPRQDRLEIDVTTPGLSGLEAEDGARIEAQGDFPAQAHLAARATDGGNVDARAIAAADVNAVATDGGEVEIEPRGSMKARAEDGGLVRYWGHPSVTGLVAEDGGAVRPES